MSELRASLLVTLLVLTAFGVTACNTIRGFGEDVDVAGEELSETAEEVKQ